MVTAIAEQPINLKRWGGFLALSFAVNFYLLSTISTQKFEIHIPNVERIRISLSALAAPKQQITSKPAPAQVIEPATVPTPAPTPAPQVSVETVEVAPEKIATLPEHQKVERKPELPVAKKVIPAPAPIPVAEIIPAPNPRVRPEKFKEITKPVEPVSPVKAPEKVVAEIHPKEPIQEKLETVKREPAPIANAQKSVATETDSASANQGDSISTVVHEADYRRRTPPVYPRRAFQLGQQGTVTLHALINSNGKPDDLKVESSSGHRLLDKAALVAVASWEFEPRIENGRRVASWVRVPVNFRIR